MSLHDIFNKFGQGVEFLWDSDLFGVLLFFMLTVTIIVFIMDVIKRDRR